MNIGSSAGTKLRHCGGASAIKWPLANIRASNSAKCSSRDERVAFEDKSIAQPAHGQREPRQQKDPWPRVGWRIRRLEGATGAA